MGVPRAVSERGLFLCHRSPTKTSSLKVNTLYLLSPFVCHKMFKQGSRTQSRPRGAGPNDKLLFRTPPPNTSITQGRSSCGISYRTSRRNYTEHTSWHAPRSLPSTPYTCALLIESETLHLSLLITSVICTYGSEPAGSGVVGM